MKRLVAYTARSTSYALFRLGYLTTSLRFSLGPTKFGGSVSTSVRFGRKRDPCRVGARWLVRRERVRARDGQVSVRSESILRTRM